MLKTQDKSNKIRT